MALSCTRGGSGWVLGRFLHGKGGQALAGAAQGGLECPSLEVPKEFLEVALRALGWGQGGHRAQLGLCDLGGLFQPQGSWDSGVLCVCPLCPAIPHGAAQRLCQSDLLSGSTV